MHCMPVAHRTWFPVSSEGLDTLGDFGGGGGGGGWGVGGGCYLNQDLNLLPLGLESTVLTAWPCHISL